MLKAAGFINTCTRFMYMYACWLCVHWIYIYLKCFRYHSINMYSLPRAHWDQLQKYSPQCSWMLFPMHVYILGYGWYSDFVLVLVPDWQLLHLVRSENFLAMLPNQGLEGHSTVDSSFFATKWILYGLARMINDSMARTHTFCSPQILQQYSADAQPWDPDDGGLRRSTTFLTAIENRNVRTERSKPQ